MMAAAVLTDLKTMTIPNRLTLPAIGLGLLLAAVRCVSGYPVVIFLLTLAASWAIVYALWAAGMWGGGDAKAVLAAALLISPLFPPLAFLAAFLLFMALSLLIRETVSSTVRAASGGDFTSAAVAISPIVLAAAIFVSLSGIGLFFPSLLAIMVFSVMADMMTAFVPYYEKALLVESSEMELAGRKAAEDVYVTQAGPVRVRKPAGILASTLFKPVRPAGAPLIPVRRSGMLPEDIRLLKRHVSYIELVPRRPMGPVLFVSLIASLIVPGASLV